MASENSELLYCYNKGCGSKFNPNENKEDSCCFHPGNPVFHDAYKGWSCCNKRSIDFTEFLNLKGCTTSFHSNVKPPEPEKPKVEKSQACEVFEYKAPVPKTSTLTRPPFDSALVKLKPEVSNVLKSQIESAITQQSKSQTLNEIQIGTSCKNSGCKAVYPSENDSDCIHHSGVPVFHEGMKYWSCCNKKTTDFAVFLEQVGCTKGKHVWVKEKNGNNQCNCRYDWHQTGTHVYISFYAKMCDPENSLIEINPVRAKVHLAFPMDNSKFDVDLELCGIVNVEGSGVSMLPTKVEVKLKKAEPGSWSKLTLDAVTSGAVKKEPKKIDMKQISKASESDEDDDDVDLEDIN